MDVIVRGKNVEITEALRVYVTRKLGKLGKFFDHQPVTAEAVLTVEKERQIVEVTIPLEGLLLRGEEATSDMYASVDLVIDKLEKQFSKYKTRRERRYAAEVRAAAHSAAALPPEATPALVRRKTFPGKPMSLDEALLQMDLLGHDFFVFRNADSNTMNVLYRRRDGDYGLLEPQ